MSEIFEREIAGRTLSMEVGKLAGLANGAVTVRYGDTVVLVTACMSQTPREGIDFFPLTVDFEERMYAAEKIPGGFFKREGRPSTSGILTARLTDRPLRPLFPDDFRNDVKLVPPKGAEFGKTEVFYLNARAEDRDPGRCRRARTRVARRGRGSRHAPAHQAGRAISGGRRDRQRQDRRRRIEPDRGASAKRRIRSQYSKAASASRRRSYQCL